MLLRTLHHHYYCSQYIITFYEFVIWVLCNFNTGPGKKKISGKEATNFPERIPIKLAEWLMRSLFVVETVSLYLYSQLILLSLVSGESLQTSLHTFFSIDMTSYFCPENLDQCLWKLFSMSNCAKNDTITEASQRRERREEKKTSAAFFCFFPVK